MNNFFLSSAKKIIALFLSGIFIIFAFIFYFKMTLPDVMELKNYSPPTPSQILSQDGQVLAELGVEKRELIQIKDIPKGVLDAFLSAEDSDFFGHQGVDYSGLMRAMFKNITAGRIVQGGSTITQQVAKTLLLTRERSIARKIKDFLLAIEIEKKFTKEEILYLYLNQVFLGGGYYGIKAAAQGYFDKDVTELTPAEAALIAGLLVAPSRYSPYNNPKQAKERQMYVLQRMFATNRLTETEYQQAIAEEPSIRVRKKGQFLAPHFTETVRQQVQSQFGEEALLSDGLTIETTLNYELYQVAQKAVEIGLKNIDQRQGYKGPLASLKTDQEVMEYDKQMRRDLLIDSSLFFKFKTNGEIQYENESDLELIDLIWSKRSSLSEISLPSIPGTIPNDHLIPLLKSEQTYRGVILGVFPQAGIIWVSLGGISGVITRSQFEWAKARRISEDQYNYDTLSNPSQVFKRGDVVELRLTDSSTQLFTLKELAKKDQKINFPASVLNQDASASEKYLHLELYQTPEVEGALYALSPVNGEVITLVGGRDFQTSQFNRALQSIRQPGSAFKTFLYALALEHNYTASTILFDTPEALSGVGPDLSWKPKNYDGTFKGPITFRKSFQESRNVPTIKIAYHLGVEKFTKYLDRIQVKTKMTPDLSFALGSAGITLEELVKGYGLYGNGGKKISPQMIKQIKDRSGGPLSLSMTPTNSSSTSDNGSEELAVEENPFVKNLQGDQLVDPQISYIMSSLLRSVIQGGTGVSARGLGDMVGGKTGTTNNYVDAWFVGFSPKLIVGVWTGFDDNKTMGFGETGAKAALPIWQMYMDRAIKLLGEGELRPPPGIKFIKLSEDVGDANTGAMELYAVGTGPDTVPIKNTPSAASQKMPEDNTQILEDDSYFDQ